LKREEYLNHVREQKMIGKPKNMDEYIDKNGIESIKL